MQAPVSDFDPQWSKDGSRIAFVRRESTGLSAVVTMAAGGGDERRLVSLGSSFEPNASWQRPQLSPDWTKVALIHKSKLELRSVGSPEVYEFGTRVRTFAWSPDSRHLVFDQTYDDNTSEIFIVDSDGSGLRSLGPGKSPAWSPSGDRILFVEHVYGALYAMQPDGSGRTLVWDGQGAVPYLPSWSPLGDRIAFYAHSALVVIDISGTRLDEILTDYYVEPPQWSFDGTLVAVEAPSVLSVFRIRTFDHWSFEGRREPHWSPVANELAASFDGRCQPYGIYRMSLLASRRLTLDCHIRGTAGPDVLTGTSVTDIVTGLAGDDELSGSGEEDRLFGGAGGDTLLGGNSGDFLQGGYGPDLLIGGSVGQDPHSEVDDVLFGGPGPDDLRGGPGRDSLSGDTGNDVLRGGPDADTLLGGPGNDRIFASGDVQEEQQVHDIVRCGPGRHDVAFVDRIDQVSGCETVHRR